MKLRKIVAAILGTQRAHNPGRRKFAGQLAGTAAAGAALGASAAQALPGTTLDDADPYRVPADQLPIVLSTDAGARGWCRLVSHPGLRVTVNGRPFGATFVDTAAKLAEGFDITGLELADLVDDGGYPPGLVRALYRDKTVGVFRGSGKVEGNPFRLYEDESLQQIEAGGSQYFTNLFTLPDSVDHATTTRQKLGAHATTEHCISAKYSGCYVTRYATNTGDGYRQKFHIQAQSDATGRTRYEDDDTGRVIELEPGAYVHTDYTHGPLAWPTLTPENEPSGWGAQIEDWSRTICDRSTVEAIGEADPVAGPYKLGEWMEFEFNTPGGEVGSAGDCWAEEHPRREIRHAAVRVYVDGQPAAQWFEGMPAGERRYWLEQQPAAVDCNPQHSREGIKWKGPPRSQALRMIDPAKDARGTAAVARERYTAALAYNLEQWRKHWEPQRYQMDVLDMLDHAADPPEPFAMHPPEGLELVVLDRSAARFSAGLERRDDSGTHTGIRKGRAKYEDATLVPSRFDANDRLQFDDDDQAGTVQAFREANRRDFETVDNQLEAWADDVRGLGDKLGALTGRKS